ncbi:NAD-dependent epimerase/dehydratase family protein [Peribacillus sp. SCS-155]|uniref:NAD-dependent epimerase/dehydratase family protein n=1 Tax=Peribacillus sedimenti TaxID=3115297 RepID=UPI003905D093
MKVLLIGGTRFIGRAVVEQLLEKGHEVALFHRGMTDSDQPVVNILGDRKNLADYKHQFNSFRPDVILDMIPMTQSDAQGLLSVAQGITNRIVALSSMDVYKAFGRIVGIEGGEPENGIIDEKSDVRENLFLYKDVEGRGDYEKILYEKELMRNIDFQSTILRLPVVYGPYDYQHRALEYIRRMKDNRPAIFLDEGYGYWKWTKGFVGNVAAGIVKAVEKPLPESRIFNIGEAHTRSNKEWIEDIGKVYGWNGEVINVKADLLDESQRANINTDQLLVVDSSLIRKELGYAEPVSYEKGLQKTIEWELEHSLKDSEPYDYSQEDELMRKLSIS